MELEDDSLLLVLSELEVVFDNPGNVKEHPTYKKDKDIRSFIFFILATPFYEIAFNLILL